MALTSLVAANAAAAAAGAGKKAAQVQLQAELYTDEEWAKFLNRDGLLVVDVYTEWCGPCIGMVGNLKKIKVEIGGDNLHLAIARADTIECLKRFRNRSEPTWMFIAAGQLLNVVFGADAPRLARTIEQELKLEQGARQGERQRPRRAPHELTPKEQEAADALEREQQELLAREAAAVEAQRVARRELRARKLETHFADVCPALMMPHAQKHLRKVADALEPFGVVVADKCPLLMGKEGARILAVEDPGLDKPAAAAALVERPALTLLLKKLPDREGCVIDLVRRGLCGEDEAADGEASRKCLVEELGVEGVPGLFVPKDRQQRAVAMDLLFPKMVGSVVEPPAPTEPPHIALLFGAWQRRSVLAACAIPAVQVRLLRYGFFHDADLHQPKLIAKTIEKYEARPDKDYGETLALMLAVGAAEPALCEPVQRAPPPQLLALGPLHTSADALHGAEECARLFPPGYSAPEHKPKPKTRKKKKKREGRDDTVEQESAADTPPLAADTAPPPAPPDGEPEPEAEGEADAEGEGEGEEEEPEGEDAQAVDKATSPPPPPQTPH